MKDTFKVIIPAEIVKSEDGEWKISGLASTANVDRQGEVILQNGIDATPIAHGKGFFNFDHDNSPENTLGLLDGYKQTAQGLYVHGRLFKNHARAQAVYGIMTSLKKGDVGRVGMSVEGKVIERDPLNPKIIKKCSIKNVALTLNPVNQDTYVDLVKSLSMSEIEFNSTGERREALEAPPAQETAMFTPSQVVAMMEKALGISGGNSMAPADRSGGDALGVEDLKKPKKKALKKLDQKMIKSNMLTLLDKLQELYPENSRSEIWNAVQDRLSTKFPQLKTDEI